MPFIFSTDYMYVPDNYQIDIQAAIDRFPFISDKTIIGDILAVYIENKVISIKEPFICNAVKPVSGRHLLGVIGDLNPLKNRGIPACQVCLALYKYRDIPVQSKQFPIMENETIRGVTYNFDDIVKRFIREEEVRIMIESTTFYIQLTPLFQLLRESQISFEEERCPDTKTSCRKILENLRNKAKNWQTVDNSKSVCEKLVKVMDSIYSFASVGGPHEGLNTKDETELILKAVAAILFYVNTLYKAGRIQSIEKVTDKEPQTIQSPQ